MNVSVGAKRRTAQNSVDISNCSVKISGRRFDLVPAALSGNLTSFVQDTSKGKLVKHLDGLPKPVDATLAATGSLFDKICYLQSQFKTQQTPTEAQVLD